MNISTYARRPLSRRPTVLTEPVRSRWLGMTLLSKFLVAVVAPPVCAGQADVVAVDVRAAGPGAYDFDVTVRHADEGWDHYANRWEILAPSGEVMATRILHHPHVDEQPFTRSLSGVSVPPEIDAVTIRAHDSVHGVGAEVVTVPLPN